MEPWEATGVGERGPCVRNLLLVPSQFRRNVKHAQTKLISSLPPISFPSSSLPSTTTMSDTEGTKKSGYRIEYANSSRAKCKGMSLSQFHPVHPSQLAHRRTRFSGPKPCAGIRHAIFRFSAFLLTAHLASIRHHSPQG